MAFGFSSQNFFFIFVTFHLFSLFFSVDSQQQQAIISNFSSSDPPWNPSRPQILVSPNSTFAAGFLPLPSSPNLYTFSIWYHILRNSNSTTTVVWSANDGSPVNRSAALSVPRSGGLTLGYPSGRNLWPSINGSDNSSATLILEETGNLVFGSWESFSFPTNTILPNQSMNNGATLSTKNGKFQLVNSVRLVFNRTETYWDFQNALQQLDFLGRISQANGGSFIGSDFGDSSKLRRLSLDEDGNLRLYSYDPREAKWVVVWVGIFQQCMVHGSCGPNAICMYDSATTATSCVCPPGFRKSASSNDSCERKVPMVDMGKTKFLRLDYVNFTGGANQTKLPVQNFATCQDRCFANNDCLGFMFKYDGSGYCVMQLERLLYGFWSSGTETAMYLRVDGSETDTSNFIGMTELMETSCPVNISLPYPPAESRDTTRNIVIITTLFAAELISGVFFFWAFLKKYIKYRDMARTFGLEIMPAGGPKRFSLAEIKTATKNFSNLIGRGGFGDVYMGKLSDGRVVAVKCLKNVTGGDADFWAEVTIIARMHHLNLVRLWGFCAEKDKRILVYEYVPNGSLNKFLFQAERDGSSDKGEEEKPVLDWNIRYRIALGVARAIAYLHEECLEWVLHCDIKPENILLGEDFCPKVSDFGLAKLKKKEDLMTMSRMRGTPGYIAPEWIRADQITPKADVYSYGLVLMEIVSGVRNFEQYNSKIESDQWYFPLWAFDKVFKDQNVEDMLDPRIKDSYDSRAHFDMVNRMAKTALWCLQDRPDSRPSMGKVAKMLEGSVEITEPKKPTVFFLSDDN